MLETPNATSEAIYPISNLPTGGDGKRKPFHIVHCLAQPPCSATLPLSPGSHSRLPPDCVVKFAKQKGWYADKSGYALCPEHKPGAAGRPPSDMPPNQKVAVFLAIRDRNLAAAAGMKPPKRAKPVGALAKATAKLRKRLAAAAKADAPVSFNDATADKIKMVFFREPRRDMTAGDIALAIGGGITTEVVENYMERLEAVGMNVSRYRKANPPEAEPPPPALDDPPVEQPEESAMPAEADPVPRPPTLPKLSPPETRFVLTLEGTRDEGDVDNADFAARLGWSLNKFLRVRARLLRVGWLTTLERGEDGGIVTFSDQAREFLRDFPLEPPPPKTPTPLQRRLMEFVAEFDGVVWFDRVDAARDGGFDLYVFTSGMAHAINAGLIVQEPNPHGGFSYRLVDKFDPPAMQPEPKESAMPPEAETAPVVQPPRAEPPPEPTLEANRSIRDYLDGHFDDQARRYCGDLTDEKVAKRLGVPRAWVASIRSTLFGPDDINEVVAREAEAGRVVVDKLAKLEADALDIATRAEALVREVHQFIAGKG